MNAVRNVKMSPGRIAEESPGRRRFRGRRGMFLVEFLICSCLGIVTCSVIAVSTCILLRQGEAVSRRSNDAYALSAEAARSRPSAPGWREVRSRSGAGPRTHYR